MLLRLAPWLFVSLWSTGYIAMKFAAPFAEPFTFLAIRFMLVVAVLSIHGVVSESFRSNASLGYNLIVGAKGGSLQLTLNTVYYLSQPVENLPYEYYLEYLSADVGVL